MRARSLAQAVLFLALGAALPGCGEERMQRGLAASDEESTPLDAKEERMTEEQRRALESGEEEAAAGRDFDGGGSGGGEAANAPQ